MLINYLTTSVNIGKAAHTNTYELPHAYSNFYAPCGSVHVSRSQYSVPSNLANVLVYYEEGGSTATNRFLGVITVGF